MNEGFARLSGYRPDEAVGQSVSDLKIWSHAEDRARLVEALLVHGEVRDIEAEFRRKDGSTFTGSVSAKLVQVNDEPHVMSITRDITDRQRAEQALRASEERLKLVLEGSNDGFWDWNMKTGATQRSPRWAEMLGYTLEEIEGGVEGWMNLIHPDDYPTTLEPFRAHMEGRTPYYEVEYRMRTQSGEWVWILDRGKIVAWDQDGKPLRMAGTHTDITARKRAEEALRASEERLKLVLEGSKDGFWDWNIKTSEHLLSPRWAEIVGYALDEIDPNVSAWEELVHPDDWPAIFRALNDHLQGHTPHYETEYRMRARSGEWVWILDRGKVVAWDAGRQPTAHDRHPYRHFRPQTGRRSPARQRGALPRSL